MPVTGPHLLTPFVTGVEPAVGATDSLILLGNFVVKHFFHDGTAIGEVIPENLSFSKQLDQPENISYEMDLSHILANPLKTKPYATDWLLLKDDVPLAGGLHTEISVSRVQDNFLNVAGLGWLHYLDKRSWPFDPLDPTANLFSMADTDLFTIVEAILDGVLAIPDSIDFQYNNGIANHNTNFQIGPGDTESILSKISTLSQTSPGFDYDCTPEKEIRLFAPQKGAGVDIVFEQDKNVADLSFVDRGPGGTHLLGLGSGFGTQIARTYDDASALAEFRRLDASKDFGEIADPLLIDSLTQAEGERQSTPIQGITCKWVSDENIWSKADVGDTATVRGDVGYEYIDANLRIVSMQSQLTAEGDEEVTLTFDDGSLSL